MSYIDSTLGSGEQVVEIFRLHKLSYVGIAIWALVFLLLSGAAPFFLVGVVAMGLMAWSLKCIEQGVTNRRVVVKKGIFSRNTNEMRAEKVEHVNVKQGLFGRMLGYGDVVVMGTGGGEVRIRSVANPLQVKRAIEEALQRA